MNEPLIKGKESNEVLVADKWNEAAPLTRNRRVISSRAALKTTDRTSYCILLDLFINESDVVQVASHLISIGARVRTTTTEREAVVMEKEIVDTRVWSVLPAGMAVNGSFGELKGDRDWREKLAAYMTNQTRSAQRPCLILWGAPGVGKTMLLERLRGENVHFFSCAEWEFSDSEEWEQFFGKLEGLVGKAARMRADDLVLLIDDFDVMHAEKTKREKLVKLLAGAECRRVLVINDYWDKKNKVLRAKEFEKSFRQLRVHGVHHASLAERIQEMYPRIDAQRAIELAQLSEGDARAALLSASLESRVGTSSLTDGSTVRTMRCGQAPHWQLLSMAQQRRPRAISMFCEDSYADLSFEKLEDVADLVNANVPGFFDKKIDSDEALAMLAQSTDIQSIAALFASKCHEEAFGTEDVLETDKRIYKDLAVLAPIVFIAPCVAKENKKAPTLVAEPVLDFPSKNVFFTAQRHVEKFASLVVVQDAVHRGSLLVEDGAMKRVGAKLIEMEERWAAMLGNYYYDKKDLARHLQSVTAKPRVTLPLEVEQWWAARMRVMAACGIEAIDFAKICQYLCRKESVPSTGDLMALYNRYKLAPSTSRLQVLKFKTETPETKKRLMGADEAEAVAVAPKKRALSAKKKLGDAAKLSMKLTSMNFLVPK